MNQDRFSLYSPLTIHWPSAATPRTKNEERFLFCHSPLALCLSEPSTKNRYFNHEEHEGGCAAGFNHRWTQVGMKVKAWQSLEWLGDAVLRHS